MGEPREIAGRRRRADADEADVVIAERPRRRDGHYLGREYALAIVQAAFAACARKALASFLSTFSRIQARNESRSLAIASHAL